MGRLRIAGLVVGASLLIGSGAASAQSEDDTARTGSDGARLSAAELRDELRDQAVPAQEDPALTEVVAASGADAQASDAQVSDASALVTEGLCYSQRYADPDEGLNFHIDGTGYELGFDCPSSTFVAATTTAGTWGIEQLGWYEIMIDTNAVSADNCSGEYTALIWWDGADVVGGLYRRASDCTAEPTFVSAVTYGRTADDDIFVGFPGAPFRSVPTLRWQQDITHIDENAPIDYMPDGYLWEGNFRTTPGNPCGGRCFYLTNGTAGGSADVVFRDLEPANQILVGDWNGDGVDSFGFRSAQTYKLKNTHAATPPDVTFGYGRPDDVVLVGDWDGNGTDTLAVRRGNTYYIRNSLGSGPADIVQAYGRASDVVLVGDWDGDGDDTLAVRRGNTYYIKNSFGSGPADITVAYGRATDTVLVGDWDGADGDSLAVRRGNTYHLKNVIGSGSADITFAYGTATDITFVGDWNADTMDTLGVRR